VWISGWTESTLANPIHRECRTPPCIFWAGPHPADGVTYLHFSPLASWSASSKSLPPPEPFSDSSPESAHQPLLCPSSFSRIHPGICIGFIEERPKTAGTTPRRLQLHTTTNGTTQPTATTIQTHTRQTTQPTTRHRKLALHRPLPRMARRRYTKLPNRVTPDGGNLVGQPQLRDGVDQRTTHP
jgi:hypothetical protein